MHEFRYCQVVHTLTSDSSALGVHKSSDGSGGIRAKSTLMKREIRKLWCRTYADRLMVAHIVHRPHGESYYFSMLILRVFGFEEAWETHWNDGEANYLAGYRRWPSRSDFEAMIQAAEADAHHVLYLEVGGNDVESTGWGSVLIVLQVEDACYACFHHRARPDSTSSALMRDYVLHVRWCMEKRRPTSSFIQWNLVGVWGRPK